MAMTSVTFSCIVLYCFELRLTSKIIVNEKVLQIV